MPRLFLVFFTAAAAAVLPQRVLADDSPKADAHGPKVDRPDNPPRPADRPGPPRAEDASRRQPGPPRGPDAMPQRPGPPRGPEGMSRRPGSPRGPEAGPERGPRPERGTPPERGMRGERGERPDFARGRDGGPERGPRPEHGMRGQRPEFARGRRPEDGPGDGRRGGLERGLPGLEGIFEQLDRNDDDQLSFEEFSEGMKRLHERMAAGRGGRYGAYHRRPGPSSYGPSFARGHFGPPMSPFARGHFGPPMSPHARGWYGSGRPPFGRERFASLPPQVRHRMFEEMKDRFEDRFEDRGESEHGWHDHGEEAREHHRWADRDDDHRAVEKKESAKKPSKEKDDEDEEGPWWKR